MPSQEGETTSTLKLSPATTRAEALVLLRRAFTEAELDTPEFDARVLLMEAVEADAVEIAARPHIPLGETAAARVAGFARRRLAREPVGRILGRREFWGLLLELSPETLEPRPDSETVVEAALSLAPARQGLTLLDLGTGSGCLLVALLHALPHATGIGVDRSPGALATARRNAWRNGVGSRAAFVVSSWATALRSRFDIIVSNPPYIRSSEIASLAPEVREHDPAAALDGGEDGIAAYRTILADAAALLAPGGILVLEIGSTQEDAVRTLAQAARLKVLGVTQDLAGHPRAVVLAPHGATPI